MQSIRSLFPTTGEEPKPLRQPTIPFTAFPFRYVAPDVRNFYLFHGEVGTETEFKPFAVEGQPVAFKVRAATAVNDQIIDRQVWGDWTATLEDSQGKRHALQATGRLTLSEFGEMEEFSIIAPPAGQHKLWIQVDDCVLEDFPRVCFSFAVTFQDFSVHPAAGSAIDETLAPAEHPREDPAVVEPTTSISAESPTDQGKHENSPTGQTKREPEIRQDVNSTGLETGVSSDASSNALSEEGTASAQSQDEHEPEQADQEPREEGQEAQIKAGEGMARDAQESSEETETHLIEAVSSTRAVELPAGEANALAKYARRTGGCLRLLLVLNLS
jgi:hypothetical protein